MSADVLAYGDDGDGRPPRGRSRAVTAAVVVAVVAAGGVAFARTRDKAPPHPRVGWTGYPSLTADPLVLDPPPDHTFDDAVSVPRPAPHAVEAIALAGGAPGFVVAIDPNYVAFDAFGGPEHAPVLVGWCAPLRTFQDAAATYVYDSGGVSYDGGEALPQHEVRDDPLSGNALEVSVGATRFLRRSDQVRRKRPCPAPLAYPPLPRPAGSVHASEGRYALVHGRYVVTTETAAFCAALRPAGCADQGWERFAPGTAITLPPGDLAGSYTWEGDFVVRASATDGSLIVVRMPGTSLVRRERVGVTVRVGLAHGAYLRDGVVHLRYNPMRGNDGAPPDDSPPGPREGSPLDVMTDVRGGLRDYAVRSDADVVIGQGVTGLGLPKGTPALLRHYLSTRTAPVAMWLVLDASGRVLRAVVDTSDFISDFLVDPVPPPSP